MKKVTFEEEQIKNTFEKTYGRFMATAHGILENNPHSTSREMAIIHNIFYTLHDLAIDLYLFDECKEIFAMID